MTNEQLEKIEKIQTYIDLNKEALEQERKNNSIDLQYIRDIEHIIFGLTIAKEIMENER